MPPGRDDDTEAIDERGYSAVDGQPDPSYLVATMDITARWPAVHELRAWELEHLAPAPGESMLDVGCGLGEVVRRYAPLVAPGGQAVGIDPSAAMLAVARDRAAADGVDATFLVSDALALDAADRSFDLCRAERVLQWLDDPEAAVREMVRVLRPRGRLCLTDTDWWTFTADLPDRGLGARFAEAIVAYKGDGAPTLVADSSSEWETRDVVALEHTDAVQVWTSWDPDAEAGPPGLFPLHDVLAVVTNSGALDDDEASRVLAHVADAARADRLSLSVTMTAAFGRIP